MDFRNCSPTHRFVFIFIMAAAFGLAAGPPPAQAQTLHVLHTFNFIDGDAPGTGVTMDAAGNFYGVTWYGGANHLGVAFKMSRHGSDWIYTPLYSFTPADGQFPFANLTIGPNGSIYGTMSVGGNGHQGTVYNLKPPQHPCHSFLCPWSGTDIYQFNGSDGGNLNGGPVVFDSAGSLYGVATYGGVNNLGVVYQLTRSGGSWTQHVIYNFFLTSTGEYPPGGVTFDSAGNLYTTSSIGGGGAGTVFQLTNTQSGWVANVLHVFPRRSGGDGQTPAGGVVLDVQGNLYGITSQGGTGLGTIYEISPSGSGWSEQVIYNFVGCYSPQGGISIDAAGNLYGVATDCASGQMYIFKLARSGDQWVFSHVHDFTNFDEGKGPNTLLTIDANGNIFGASGYGGSTQGSCAPDGCGTVWEITP